MEALIFDLDGTLVDTVYAHVFAWQRALAEANMTIDAWRIHRRIGMSGGLFARGVGREIGRELTTAEVGALQARHGELFRKFLVDRPPLPGAVSLLAYLKGKRVPFGIATSGRRPDIDKSLDALQVDGGTVVIEGGSVARAKPEPDLFLECQRRLGVKREDCYVVGDAVWDMLAARRAGMLCIGLLTGGYGSAELVAAGAFRVYRDPAELHQSLDEIGITQGWIERVMRGGDLARTRNPIHLKWRRALEVAAQESLLGVDPADTTLNRPGIKLGICGEHGGEPESVKFCHRLGLDYGSCSPFRVPIARLAAAQAALQK